MSEWFDSQRKPKSDVRTLLQERVNVNRTKREVLTDEEQVTQNGLFRRRKNVRFTASLPKMAIFEQLHLE